MNLDFEWMDVTDFRSFIGKHRFVFNKGPGLHFVRGRNEQEPSLTANDSGKSTLFDCLSWVLFGKTTKGLRNPNLVPWGTKGKTPEGGVSVRIDKKSRRIARKAEVNGILLDGESADQTAIEKLLQLNHETFLHTILLGQGEPLFFDLQPRQKMDLFGEVLNLERWEQRAKKAFDKVTFLQTRQDTRRGQIDSMKHSLKEAITIYEAIKEKSEGWSKENQRGIGINQNALKAAKKDLAKVQKIKEDTTLKYESASVEAKALRPVLEKLLIEIVANRVAIQKLVTLANDKRSTQRYLLQIIASLDEGGTCPTCKQPIKGTKIEEHVREHKKQLQLYKNEENALDKKIKPLADKDARLIRLRDRQKENLVKFEEAAEAVESTLHIVTTDVANYEATCRSLTRYIKDAEEAENPYREQLSQIRRNKSKLASDLKQVDEDLGKLEGQISRTKYWVRGFRDIRLYIIEEVLHELELATNTMLPEVGLHDWQVSYDIEKENKSGTTTRGLNATILSPNNKKFVPWEVWGGGVGQRLRVVSALALSEVLLNYAGIAPNIEILDEPTAHLSTTGVRDLCDFLANRAETLGRGIFFVDHRSIESTHFSSVTTIVKDKKGSHIES